MLHVFLTIFVSLRQYLQNGFGIPFNKQTKKLSYHNGYNLEMLSQNRESIYFSFIPKLSKSKKSISGPLKIIFH